MEKKKYLTVAKFTLHLCQTSPQRTQIEEIFTFQKKPCTLDLVTHLNPSDHSLLCMPAHKRIPYIRQVFNKEVEAETQGNETLYDRIVLIRHTSSLYEDIESSYLDDRIASIRQSSSLNQNIITAPFSERIESTRKTFNHATELINIAKKDNREIKMAGSTHPSSSSEITSGQKQILPSSGPSESRSRMASKEASPEGSVQSFHSQEAPLTRDPSPSPSPSPSPAPAPAPKPVRSRLKIEKQVELLEICERWIRLYVHDKNGGKIFWDKVHEVLENAGTKYSADSIKNFVTSMVYNYEQRAPIEKELEGPLRAWKSAVDSRKKEEKLQKIDEKKAKKEKAEQKKADKEKAEKEKAVKKKKLNKEKADKEKADKEKADKEKTDKEKADKEKAIRMSGSKKPVASKKPGEAPRTTVPDSQEDMEQGNSTGDTSIPSIESDPVARQPKRKLTDIKLVGESPQKRPRTRSFTTQTEGRPRSITRAKSLQPGQTQRRPSVPPRTVAKPAAKPSVIMTPSSKPGEKRKRPAPKASEDDTPEASTRPAKKGKTTNDFLEEMTNGLASHLTRIETNIDGKFEEVKQELEVMKMEIANLSQWHVQLNDAINHEQGIAIKESSKVETRNSSKAVVNNMAEVEVIAQSSGNEDELDELKSTDESKSTHESDELKSTDEDAEPTATGAWLETIDEVTEITEISTSGKIEEQAPEGEDLSKDAMAAESSGDDNSSSSSDEDEEVSARKITKQPGRYA